MYFFPTPLDRADQQWTVLPAGVSRHSSPTSNYRTHFMKRITATENTVIRERWQDFVLGCLIQVLGDGGDYGTVLKALMQGSRSFRLQ